MTLKNLLRQCKKENNLEKFKSEVEQRANSVKKYSEIGRLPNGLKLYENYSEYTTDEGLFIVINCTSTHGDEIFAFHFQV